MSRMTSISCVLGLCVAASAPFMPSTIAFGPKPSVWWLASVGPARAPQIELGEGIHDFQPEWMRP